MRDDDIKEILKLLKIVIGLVISCEKREVYIMRLMTLNESVQMQLMPFIAPIVEKIDDKSTAEE